MRAVASEIDNGGWTEARELLVIAPDVPAYDDPAVLRHIEAFLTERFPWYCDASPEALSRSPRGFLVISKTMVADNVSPAALADQ